jgi:murein DD-endopeptidase MepM/ murein hydrolase activator NlpD
VYATHSGTVTSGDASLEDFNKNDEIDDNDRATCRSNAATQGNYYGCTGIYVAIKGANYTTIYMHLQSINTACVPQNGSGQVVQGALIGFVDSTGNSTGNHLHYEIRQNNGSMVPLDSLSSVMPDWKVSSVEASYSGGGCGQ